MDPRFQCRALSFQVPLATLAGLLSAAAGAHSDAQTVTFAEVMRRVHAYVVVYQDHELSTIMARERYHQQWLDGRAQRQGQRTLLSDYVLLQLPDEDWVAVRDVYEVDGTAVAERTARLKSTFHRALGAVGSASDDDGEESARFNLGELYYRTVNLPTFALRVLSPANRKRFAFEKAGEEQVDGRTTWIVALRETKGPTFSARARRH